MSTNGKPSAVLEEVDFLLLEGRQLKSARLHFKIEHHGRVQGTEFCKPGEEVAACYLVSRGREFLIPLSLTLRLVFDFLAKNSRLAQCVSQIAAGFRADPFYTRHGANVAPDGSLRRRVARSAVRVYVQRIRRALALTFREANLRVDPNKVLVSQETVTNQVGYRLRGTFQWLHSEHPGRKFTWVK